MSKKKIAVAMGSQVRVFTERDLKGMGATRADIHDLEMEAKALHEKVERRLW